MGLHPFPGTRQATDGSSDSSWSLPDGLRFNFYLYDFYEDTRIRRNKGILAQWLQAHGVVVNLYDIGRQRGLECGVIAAKVLTMLYNNPELLGQPTRLRDEALSDKTLRESNTHLVERGRLHDSYRDTLKSLILDEAQVKELAFMHMRTIPTSAAVLQDRWPFQCTAFDEMLVNLGTIMKKAARIPKSSLSFFCCNTEATSAAGFHWMSAVFEVIAPGIGQGAAASGAQLNQRLREMKRRKTRRNQPVDQPVHLV